MRIVPQASGREFGFIAQEREGRRRFSAFFHGSLLIERCFFRKVWNGNPLVIFIACRYNHWWMDEEGQHITNEERILVMLEQLQTQMYDQFGKIDGRFERIDKHFGDMEARLEQMNSRQDLMQADIAGMKEELLLIPEIKEQLFDIHNGINAMVEWIENIDNRKRMRCNRNAA